MQGDNAPGEPMTTQAILLPLFVEVILTFLLLFWLAPLARARFQRRRRAAGERSRCASRTGRRARCKSAIAFSNQFELPVLFYVLTILAYVTHLAGVIFVVLAWIFVIFRICRPTCM